MTKKIYQCVSARDEILATFCIEEDARAFCANHPGSTYKIIEFQSTEYSL